MAVLAPISDPPIILSSMVGGLRIPVVYSAGIAIAVVDTLAMVGLAEASEYLSISLPFRAVQTMVPDE